jgi:hypothetical protein
LRRWIGAEQKPFAPLPELASAKHRRYVAEICALERNLVSHLQSVNNDLRRRIKSRKEKRTWNTKKKSTIGA